MASATVVRESNGGAYSELLSSRGHKCVQDVKLHKMMSTLDLSNFETSSVKTLPGNFQLFETTKTVNMFPAFKSRRERSILDLSSSKSLPDRESLSNKLEMAKAEQRKKSKSMISLSGSKIRKKKYEMPQKHPKVWSLHLSRTLPNISQCFTPLPPKTPYKNLTIRRDLQEKKVTLSENSVALDLSNHNRKRRILPKTPPNSHRLAFKVASKEQTSRESTKKQQQPIEMSMPLIIPVSGRVEKKEPIKTEPRTPDKPEDIPRNTTSPVAEWVTVEAAGLNHVDKTTMTDDNNIVRILTPSSSRIPSSVGKGQGSEIQKSERPLASRGGLRPNKLLPDMPKMTFTKKPKKEPKTDDVVSNAGSLPKLPEKQRESTSTNGGRRSGPGFPKRLQPAPFKVAHSVFTDND